MPTQEKILDFLSKNKQEFKDIFNITKLGLFGSFANGSFNKNSDIDIII
jgi:predicted nucleotidyltransferase